MLLINCEHLIDPRAKCLDVNAMELLLILAILISVSVIRVDKVFILLSILFLELFGAICQI